MTFVLEERHEHLIRYQRFYSNFLGTTGLPVQA